MRGTSEEFRLFVAARAQQLYSSAWFLCGDQHLAEDLMQEALLKMYLVWGKREIDNPVAYAHTTLTRIYLSRQRRRSNHEIPSQVITDTDETAQAVHDVDLRLDLQAALARLPDLDRVIVVMRYLEDRPVEEVATALGMRSGTVRARASRAVAKLRDTLGLLPGDENLGLDISVVEP